MATSEPALGRQKSREGLDLELTERSAKPKPSTTACSVQIITSGPEFGNSKPQQKQVQFEDQKQQFGNQEDRVESDSAPQRCIGRAGTKYHKPNGDPCPDSLVISQNYEEFLADHTPTTPVTATRRRLASISDGSRKPYINLHKAIQDNNTKVVKAWLQYNKRRPNRNRIKDRHGFAPVHYAVKFNRIRLLEELCNEGKADVSEKTVSEEYTPLHLAARFNSCCYDHSTDEQGSEGGEGAQPSTASGAEESHDGPQTTSTRQLRRLASIEQVLTFLMDNQKVDVNVVDKFGITPLHLACQVGNREAVKLLVKRPDIDLTAKDVNGDTPLHEACFHGRLEIVTKLLKKIKKKLKDCEGATVDSVITDKNDLGLTPFHLACREGRSEIVSKLLEFSDNPLELVECVDCEGSTSLHLACQSDKADIVKSLLAKGASMDVFNDDGVSPVHVAAQFGSVAMMKELVHVGRQLDIVNMKEGRQLLDVVNMQDNYHQTPLHFASEYGKKDMVKYLIKNRANIEAKDVDNYTSLLTAAEFGQTEIFRLLLELKPRPASLTVHNMTGKSALFLAAESNHPEIIKIIFEFTGKKHSVCSKVDASSNTPLHVAAEKGHAVPLKLLLEHVKSDGSGCPGMKADDKNVLNKTIMHLAAENGHLHAMTELQQHCSDLVKSTDENGNTPLHLACMNGYVEVAKLLMKMDGADIGARNEILWTPIDCAASNGHARVVHELVSAKAEIDPKDKLKTTPLHLAAKEGHVTAVETLIEHNASVTSRDHRGYNPLDWAIENGHRDVAEAIIKSPKWKYALRNHTVEQNGKETTPFRKLIRRMPDVAEMVLKKCTTPNTKVKGGRPDPEEYSVAFNYEFLEDRELAKEWREDAENAKDRDKQYPDDEKVKRPCCWYYSSKRLLHPLQVMVDSKRTELLKHPLVYNLIEHKWTYTQFLFALILFFHVTFVAILTAYALLLLNPLSPTCVAVSSNLYDLQQRDDIIHINVSNLQAPHDQVFMEFLASVNGSVVDNSADISGYTLCFNASTSVKDALANAMLPVDTICGSCGQSVHQRNFVFVAAVIIILLSIFQLVIEVVHVFLQPQVYLTDLASWIKVPYIACSIIFAFTFFNSCLCPKPWQWQVGIVAVFLVWADLIFYIRKIRVLDTGIYILMFEKIFKRFLRLVIFTILLISMFALTFHMAFHQYHPFFEKSPFATPFHALWKTFTMTTGEVDYNSLFRQPSEGSPDLKDIPDLPFPEISFILWIAFLVLIPILFTNLLVGLAVDDIKAILEEAELTRLTLRVKLILNLEDGFLNYIIRKYRMKSQRNSLQRPLSLVVHPFRKTKKNWIRRKFPLVRRLMRGEDYSSAEHIADVINPTQTPIEQQTQSLMRELSKIHDTLQQIPKLHESLHRVQEDLDALSVQVMSLTEQRKSTTQTADCATHHDLISSEDAII